MLLFTQQKNYEEGNASEEYQFKHGLLLLAAVRAKALPPFRCHIIG